MSFFRQLVAARPRMFLAILFAVAAWFVFARTIPDNLRTLATWNTGCVAYIALAWNMMFRSTEQAMKTRAKMQDESRWVILVIIVAAAAFSLVAIVDVLHQVKDQQADKAVPLALAGLTIVASWFLVHTVFALHYAHEFYSDRLARKTKGYGLNFPEDDKPNYGDFLYFSFVVGMTCQVSDVCVTSKGMRQLTLFHGVLAFFFNTVILALSINIAAGML